MGGGAQMLPFFCDSVEEKQMKSVRAGKETVIEVQQLMLSLYPFHGRVVLISI